MLARPSRTIKEFTNLFDEVVEYRSALGLIYVLSKTFMKVREARVLSKRAIERVHHRQGLFTMLGLKI